MGAKPSAASTATTKTTAIGRDVTSPSGTGPTAGEEEFTPTNSRFAMPHALVIIACIATAAILATLGMTVQDVLLLISGAGAIGAGIVVLVVTGGRRGGSRVGRFMRAYLSTGS
ncbi:hypothetical protein ACF064_35535 [Streptomyces sp. NPDC015492]|uniref:hypothetical protein n=1 Tax=Streptomyces sp. NPDC015492 TaxID=3364958 RepID=UPI0036FC750D